MTADISLMYQPTSWEYIQFLDHANDGSVAFLANEGANILDAWLNTGMAAPHVMETTTWTAMDSDGDGIFDTVDNCTNVANAAQIDTDGDGHGNACDGDFNNSCGSVNLGDLVDFKAAFGTVDPEKDLNNSGGSVNLGDLVVFKALFGSAPGPSACGGCPCP